MFNKSAWVVIIILLLMGNVSSILAAPHSQSITCAEDYSVQVGDWLSTIADKYYGDVQAYTVIVQATNMAALEDNKYSPISDPALIEPTQILCIPSNEPAEAIINGRMEIPHSPPVMPEDKMLLIVGNRTLANIPSTLTISGGALGGGEEFVVDASHEVRIELEPGEYRATWSSPEGVTFGRKFKARPGTVVLAWIIPEDSEAFTEVQHLHPDLENINPQEHMGQLAPPSVTTTETPYSVPEGKSLLVAGNRSLAHLPSTLTLSGGQFGGGQEFFITPGQEAMFALEPGSYRATWSAPDGQDGPYSLSRNFRAIAGKVSVIWLVPEESRAFLQRPGEVGQELK